MQVPEKLALIGGSILLASTLIFTLKSQASQILPKINDASSNIFDHIGDVQKNSDFNSNYQQAQRNGQKAGTWGTAKYYINGQGDMHIGGGQLQGTLNATLGGNSGIDKIRTVNIDQGVRAPQDSDYLFASRTQPQDKPTNNIVAINGLNNVDTSMTTSMGIILGKNSSLKDIDLSSWDTHNVTDINGMLEDNASLQNVSLSHWDTRKVNNMTDMFNSDVSLTNLNIDSFDTRHANTVYFIGGVSTPPLETLKLGPNTIIKGANGFPAGNWKNGDQTIDVGQLTTVSHPGTWVLKHGI